MKNLRRVILTMLCLAVIFGTVACGNANDDANNNNDVTEGTDNKDKAKDDDMTGGDGNIIDDAGNAAGDVIDDIGNGVEDITDDVTGNDNNSDNANR